MHAVVHGYPIQAKTGFHPGRDREFIVLDRFRFRLPRVRDFNTLSVTRQEQLITVKPCPARHVYYIQVEGRSIAKKVVF